MGLTNLFTRKRKRSSAAQRREFLLANGRIAEATIIESETTETGEEMIRYHYNVQGVDFESSEILTEEQRKNSLNYSTGAKVSVRFDPKNHWNSILI